MNRFEEKVEQEEKDDEEKNISLKSYKIKILLLVEAKSKKSHDINRINNYLLQLTYYSYNNNNYVIILTTAKIMMIKIKNEYTFSTTYSKLVVFVLQLFIGIFLE